MPWLVVVYSASSGLAFMLLSVALWLTFAVQERILKFRRHALGGAFRAFKIHREHWTQSMEKLRDFYFRLESERESVTKTFDDDMQGITGLVARAGFTFCVGVLGLGVSVVCVVTAKLVVVGASAVMFAGAASPAIYKLHKSTGASWTTTLGRLSSASVPLLDAP